MHTISQIRTLLVTLGAGIALLAWGSDVLPGGTTLSGKSESVRGGMHGHEMPISSPANPAEGAVASLPAAVPDDRAVREVVVRAVPHTLRFDVEAFYVRAGSAVRLVLENPDEMPHNLLICTGEPGIELRVAEMVYSLPDPLGAEYVPDTEHVLAATRLLEPGESDTVLFEAPAEPGEYPYVCTVPGHAQTMRGIMRVVEDDADMREAVTAPALRLQNLRYEYYEAPEGAPWRALPDFDELTPVTQGKAEEDLIGVTARQRDGQYGFRFEGELLVAEAGSYAFSFGYDDASRVFLDGERIAEHRGFRDRAGFIDLGDLTGVSRSPVRKTVVDLEERTYSFRADFFAARDARGLQVAWSRTGPGEDLHFLSRETAELESYLRGMHVVIDDEPEVVRAILPDTSTRSLAVGLPDGVHYCFDTENAVVRYAWTGAFLDVSPERHHKGGEDVRILGERFDLGVDEQPLRLTNPAEAPRVEYIGYRRHRRNPPELLYRVDGVEVSQVVSALPAEGGLRYDYVLSSAKSPVYFVMNRDGLEVSVSTGTWDGDVLKISSGPISSFSIKIHPAND